MLGLFANEEMFQQAPEGEGAIYDPPVSLSQMTQEAIETLSQDPEGFFLMVEEESIVEMVHQGNAELLIKAGQQLEEAVKVGQSFAEIQSDPEYPNESGEGRTAEDGPFRVANSDKMFLVD